MPPSGVSSGWIDISRRKPLSPNASLHVEGSSSVATGDAAPAATVASGSQHGSGTTNADANSNEPPTPASHTIGTAMPPLVARSSVGAINPQHTNAINW